MLSLSNFFQPLNPLTLFYFVCLFFFFDIVGTHIRKKFIGVNNLPVGRILNWLIGFGIFIFVWFVISLFLAPTALNILISVSLFLLATSPSYIKDREFKSLLTELWKLKVPILIILPFLPAVFVKSSLPPYYSDEMAYHFISPSALNELSPIKYVGGIYGDLPRILDFFWQIIFTLTKTYSVARLFHFTILATSLIYSFEILKKNFGLLTGFLFVFVFLSLPQDIILTSTLGYIDVGAYSFLLIAIVSSVDFLISKTSQAFVLTFIFWGLNLGTKYTGVSSFISFAAIFFAIILWNKKEYSKVINKSLLVKSVIGLVLFGCYWYIKNFIWFGNPIFPFLFPCPWGIHVEKCPATGSFFGDWTTKINLANTYLILSQLFVKNVIIHALVFAVPIFSLFSSNKKVKGLILLSFSIVLIELFMLKYFSGFYIRYQQHMQLYLLLGVVIGLTAQYKNWIINFLVKSSLLLLVLSSIYLYIYTVRHTNSLNFLNLTEISFARGKIDIYGWIDIHFPRMKYTIKWCENPPDGKPINLARFDPDLIWFDYDGLKRAFLTNCYYVNPIDQSIPIDQIISVAKNQKLRFWIASANKCLPDNKVVKRFPYERDDMTELRKFNNKIVCNSTEVELYLYYFDYSKVK